MGTCRVTRCRRKWRRDCRRPRAEQSLPSSSRVPPDLVLAHTACPAAPNQENQRVQLLFCLRGRAVEWRTPRTNPASPRGGTHQSPEPRFLFIFSLKNINIFLKNGVHQYVPLKCNFRTINIQMPDIFLQGQVRILSFLPGLSDWFCIPRRQAICHPINQAR